MTARNLSAIRVKTPQEKNVLQPVEAFCSGVLPGHLWNHETKITVAAWFLWQDTLPRALARMRSSIIMYLHQQGLKDSPKKGYHETLTQFWMRTVDYYLKVVADRSKPFAEVCAGLLKSGFADKNLPLVCYSRARLYSEEAGACWLAPDLMSLE